MSAVDNLDSTEQIVLGLVAVVAVVALVGVAVGVLKLAFLLPTLALTGMWVLLTLGLNVQWGYAGLINFSVAAFWGIGIYSAALLTSPASPLGVELSPLFGFLAAGVVSAVIALLIGIPTLRLRTDYLAIASLGLAEVIRLIILNEREITAGSSGVSVPPLLEPLPLTQGATDLAIVLIIFLGVYLFLRRIHRSPWGRVLRTIRSDEDLAKALGKNTYRYKMQAFVIGSVIMALAGAFYAHQFRYVTPTDLLPITSFYVWVAVILGGTGSNRGAVLGAFTIILIREGTRFIDTVLNFFLGFFGLRLGVGLDVAALRLLIVGLLIILVVRVRSQGILPPRDELIWPAARKGGEE